MQSLIFLIKVVLRIMLKIVSNWFRFLHMKKKGFSLVWKTQILIDIKGERFIVEKVVGYSLYINEYNWIILNRHGYKQLNGFYPRILSY